MTQCAFFQKLDEFGLHERIVVWYVQADHLLAEQMASEASSQQSAVPLLHDTDDVSPIQLIRSQGTARIFGKAGRVCLDARQCSEHRFSGGTAQLVAAADKKHFLHLQAMSTLGRCPPW